MSDSDEAAERHVGLLVKVGHWRRHRVINGGAAVSRYLLIQGPGPREYGEGFQTSSHE